MYMPFRVVADAYNVLENINYDVINMRLPTKESFIILNRLEHLHFERLALATVSHGNILSVQTTNGDKIRLRNVRI